MIYHLDEFDYFFSLDPQDSKYELSESNVPSSVSAPNSVLKIVDLTTSDRAQYICRTQFLDGNTTTTFYLRVSGKVCF